MATILLSAAGAAIGGFVGGGALGLSSVVIGRAIGATVGRAIDQSLMGSGSEVIESGKLDRVRLMGASEGGAIPRAFGRVRLPGNVIWASNYKESVTTTQHSGGKGAPKGPTTRSYSYSVSLAVAVCEGEIARIGRIWADGSILSKEELNLRVYPGDEMQLPDPVISAIEGEGFAPAYRGLAYVVFEDLPLEPFGNRVPQFSFEVVRHSSEGGGLAEVVQAVAMMPGTGEYALATTPVYRKNAAGADVAVNVNTAEGGTDFEASLRAVREELPKCRSTSLVVSWFGDDLRAGQCQVQPKVETHGGAPQSGLGSRVVFNDEQENNFWPIFAGQTGPDRQPWYAGGFARGDAALLAETDGRPVYGGTPSDASVLQAISALKAQGQEVMFYPFLLMELLEGNGKPDPWREAGEQPALPWRGRITTHKAPGIAGSTDQSAAARSEVESFFGAAQPSDFALSGGRIVYSGPAETSYRRFILHYAHLCAQVGGVDAFCIGSEMRSLTQIRDETGAFPAVEAFRQLAAEVRAILPGTKISYAADWSEYFGYHPQDGSGDVLFHLDPLWADDNIDFIGIDNYMPIADWRDEETHLDAGAGSIYALDYLRANIAGGEGFDWYYRDPGERDKQIRTPIADGAYGEDWVWRYKDLVGWWNNPHHNRQGGVRAGMPTGWLPGSKPIVFTELGCAAIDKGPNQPNKFLDPKSSESGLPHYSSGRRDDFVQLQYLRAYHAHFAQEANNPVSPVYGEPMVDMGRAHIWAWDARPWPNFPNNLDLWSDGENHIAGHWLTGRSGAQSLASVVAELLERSGLEGYDVSGLEGVVRGFSIADVESARASLQVLMLAYGFDVVEQGDQLIFKMRGAGQLRILGRDDFVLSPDQDAVIETTRAPEVETAGAVRVGYALDGAEFETGLAEARFPGDDSPNVTQTDLPLSLSASEARAIAERWMAEARVARDTVSVTVPPSRSDVLAGDVVELKSSEGAIGRYRVDRVTDTGARALEATRVQESIYAPSDAVQSLPSQRPFTVPIPIVTQFMDLPLLTGEEVPHAPHVALSASPWPGSAAVYTAAEDAGYALNSLIERPAVMGVSETLLPRARAGLWDDGAPLRVRLLDGALSSQSDAAVLNGANVAAIGDGSNANWEVFQFAQADLVGDGVYELRRRLRGQVGSDGIAPEFWPVGSTFVLLDGAPRQIEQALGARDLARHYRVGPALRAVDDPSYRHYVEAFPGIGLRPYAPAHLRAMRGENGLEVSWIRRTRIEGDSWSSVEVPLGEESESYVLRISKDGAVLREVGLTTGTFFYSTAAAAADGAVAPFEIAVAQVSQSFGPGPFARRVINDG